MGDELAGLDATAQADLVRRGEATPQELVDAAIARIEALDDRLNAVVLRRFEPARDEAKAMPVDPLQPFCGVPFLTKDLRCPTAGELTSEGMRFLKDAGWRSPWTAALATRFRNAGLVNLGRTNSPELGLVPTTEPIAWGATHNPWDPTRSPGGSSGGSAAAVAAGLVAVAHGSDGGGSIRIPASACGLVGLKPSRGRVSLAPAAAELTIFLSVQFALTRTVRDTAALLDVCAGPEVGDFVIAPAPAQSFLASIDSPPPRLRVGIMTEAPGGGSVHEECITAVEHTAKLLESLGHDVERAHPDAYDDEERGGWFGQVWGVNAATALAAWGDAIGREVTADDVEPGTWAMAEVGRRVSTFDYVAAQNHIQEWTRRMAAWWRPADGAPGFDLLLTPTLAEPPAPLGTFAATPDEPFKGMLRAGPYTPFTPAFNMSGQPAISLPLHRSAEGLPIGVHFVAEYAREDLLLALAAQLEQAAPWSEHRPTLHA